jgi:hypothetical protein
MLDRQDEAELGHAAASSGPRDYQPGKFNFNVLSRHLVAVEPWNRRLMRLFSNC